METTSGDTDMAKTDVANRVYYCTDEQSQNEPMEFEATSAEAAEVAFQGARHDA